MSASQFEVFLQRVKGRLEPINWFLAAALVVSVVAALPLLSQPGFLNTRGGGDSPFLLQRVQQLGVAIADGHFPVRWMADASYGFGYPFFNYYAPLSIYISASLSLLGFGLVWAVKITQLPGFIVAAWAMFALGRRWFGSNWAGLLTSATYSLAPFHMVNVYVRGDSLAEFWAMAFYPILLLLADTLARRVASHNTKQIIRAVVMFSLGYAALIISHNISALIFTPFLLLYIVLIIVIRGTSNSSGESGASNRTPILLWTLIALIGGLALSAWFWLPALVEQSFAQLDPVTSGYFSYENHFRDLDLIQTSVAFDYDVAGGRSFSMGLFQAILGLSGVAAIIIYTWRKRGNKSGTSAAEGDLSTTSGLFIVLSLIVATIMITALSQPLWDNLPLLSFTQFPWRFLSVQAFAAALATGGLALLPWRRFLVPIIVVLLVVTSLVSLKPDFLELGDEDVTEQKIAEYEWFTGNIGSTVSAEYLPESVAPRPFTSSWINEGDRNRVLILEGEIGSEVSVDRRTARQNWSLRTLAPSAVVVFPTFYWPGWKAEIDGEATDIWSAPGSGLITIEIPSGSHQIEIWLTRTPVRWLGELLSLAFAIIAITLLVWTQPKKPRWKRLSAVMAVTILVLILVWIWPGSSRSDDDLSWDFQQLAYLHHTQDGTIFSDGTILGSYSYDREEVTAGDELRITLQWDQSPKSDVTVDLVSPAINRFEEAPIVASQTLAAATEPEEVLLKIPDNAPAGLHVPRLLVNGATALTSSENSRGDLFLRPIRIRDQPQPAGPSGSVFDVQPVTVHMRNSEILEVQLQWLTRAAQSHNFKYSLRLVDASGAEVAQIDSQPGYGFLPSSLWPTGQWIDDWISMPLSPDLKQSYSISPYALVARLYDAATGQVVFIRRLGELNWLGDDLIFAETEPSFSIPTMKHVAGVTFGDEITLLGYDEMVSDESLSLVLYWQALAAGMENYYLFVHLIDLTSGEIVAQHDGMPRFETYPTSQWSLGEIVSDPAVIDLKDIPPGSYQLALGLYHTINVESCADCFRRLFTADGDGNHLSDDRFILPDLLIIE